MMSQTKQKSGELELRQAFRLFDADNDGFITFDDLKRVMRNCGENLSDSELKHMFTKADVNNDNRVDMKGKWLLVTSCACSHLRLKHGLPAEINKTPPPPSPRPAPPQSPCWIQRVNPGWLASLVDLVTWPLSKIFYVIPFLFVFRVSSNSQRSLSWSSPIKHDSRIQFKKMSEVSEGKKPELLAPRGNGRKKERGARGRHAMGDGAPAWEAHENRFYSLFECAENSFG